jgi:hypothetical protein
MSMEEATQVETEVVAEENSGQPQMSEREIIEQLG